MKLLPLVIVTVLYVIQAIVLWHANDRAGATIFAGYALANLGMMATL